MSLNGNRGKTFYDGQEVYFDLPDGWDVLAMAEPRSASGQVVTGWHWPRALHVSLGPHNPHNPPHPSLPHSLPSQSGMQTG